MGPHKQPPRLAAPRCWLAVSSLAMATAMLHPVPVLGQTVTTANGVAVRAQASFQQGTLTYTPGTPTPAGTATDVVRVNQTDTLINWVPYDMATGGGPISFLPAGNGLFYIFDGGNFTVVNRIMPTDATRAVRFDGQVAAFANNGETIGGNIFFFSPGGIIVGGTGRFDVGSLVLTTSEITQTVSTSTTLAFAPATQPNSKITIEPWAATGAGDVSAQLQTFGGNSYLALVAPTVEMFGRADAQGNVAYVAAEAATMTISGSLFDIVVNTGTTSAKGIEHTGITTGSASGTSSQRRIQMVAVPKNDALTMLVSGTVGYQPADTATIVNGSIVLSAGGADEGGKSDIEIGEAQFLDDTLATATGDLRFKADGSESAIVVGSPGAPGPVDFIGAAGGDVSVSVANGAGLAVSGDLTLTAGGGDTGGNITIAADATGISVPTVANGIAVGGNLSLSTAAFGADDFATGGIGTDAVAGDISVTLANSAQLGVGGDLTLDTSAQAGFGDAQSGDATAGSVTVSASGASSTFSVAGLTNIDTRALAAVGSLRAGPLLGEIGGDSRGGDVSLLFNGVDTSFGGGLQVNTSAQGSSGRSSVTQDNSARAGDISLSFTGGTHDIFHLDFDANGIAGLSIDGAGNVLSGTVGRALVGIALDGATVTTADDNTISATTAGDISASAPADAIRLTAINGSSFTSNFFEARTSHDNVSSTNPGTAGGIAITADNSTLALGLLTLEAEAFASAAISSNKTGGSISLSALNNALISANNASLQANASEPLDAVGPSVNTGGAISLIATDADMTFTGATSIGSTVDPGRGEGAVSTGGAVTIRQTGAASDLTFGNLSISTVSALADAGDNVYVGNGGDAVGGKVTIDVQGGNFTADGLYVSTFANGQDGGSLIAATGDFAGDGGSATGGDISIIAAGTSFSPGILFFTSSATGGRGATGSTTSGAAGGGAGGSATAGSIDFQALAGTVDLETLVVTLPPVEVIGPIFGPFITTLNMSSFAVGGNGGFGDGTAGGAGGSAVGGSVTFNSAGADVTVDVGAIALSAGAYGGNGGNSQPNITAGANGGPAGAGGSAMGGTASYLFTGGTTNLTAVYVDAAGFGGNGGNHVAFSGGPTSAGGAGGNATGGTATVTIGVDDASSAIFSVTATAYGGDGGYGPYGAAGGNAQGGGAQFNVANANVGVYSLAVRANATGGDGGAPRTTGAPGGAGGNGTGGDASIDVFGLAGALSSEVGIDITSTGTGGAGAVGAYLGDGGAGGIGRGGGITIYSRDGASLALLTPGINGRGVGGYGGDAGGYDSNPPGPGGAGGAGYGGSLTIGASGGGSIAVSSLEGPVMFSSTGTGGRGGDSGYQGYYYSGSGTPGANGTSNGGSVDLLSTGAGSQFQINSDLVVNASATGFVDFRSDSVGADASGGRVGVAVSDGGALSVSGNATLDASALATLGSLQLGDAKGGKVRISMSGAASTLDVAGSLVADASAIDSRTESFAYAVTPGGNFTGGIIEFDFDAGTATVGGDTQLIAIAGVDTSEGPGYGDTTTGGSVSLINGGSASFTTGVLDIETYALGTAGRRSTGGVAENGGNATGGSVYFSNEGTGSLTASSISIDSHAVGGEGGRGDGSGGIGGVGGIGMAGDVTVLSGSTLQVADLTVVATGTGGRGGSGTTSGAGGQGIGGAVAVTLASTIDGLNQLSLTATGTGGAGVTDFGYYYSSYGGNGSTGGDGTGGLIELELTGAGTVLTTTTDFSLGLDVTGTGGRGGYGGNGYLQGGDGGAGGNGAGGTLTLASRGGATLDLTGLASTISANGVGGAGGAGGYGDFGDGVEGAGYGGDGGNGGTGTGGSLFMIGQGGTIASGDIELTATGAGGLGGAGGIGYYFDGAVGANGGGSGGLVSVQALEGSPGVITLGAVTIDASGLAGGGDFSIPTTGGSIEIIDASTDLAGLITLGALTATAAGAIAPADASFTMSGDSGPITVTNDVLVNVVGDIVFAFDGSGQLVVGGDTTLIAGGDILLTHGNNTGGVASIDAGGDFTATAGGNFNAGPGSIASGSGNLSITAQDIVYSEIDALGSVVLNALAGSIGFVGSGNIVAGTFIDLDAAQAITINDASGAGSITLDAGSDITTGDLVHTGGDLPAAQDIALTAGGAISIASANAIDAFFATGDSFSATGVVDGESVAVDVTGAIDIGALASESFATLSGGSVVLDSGAVAGDLTIAASAGGITFGTVDVEGLLGATASGGIAFTDITGLAVTLDAGGAITGGVVAADRAVPSGTPRDVKLTATGAIVIDSASAVDNVAIDAASLAANSISAGAGGGGNVTVTTTGATTIGQLNSSGAGAGEITISAGSMILGDATASGATQLTSTAGDVTIGSFDVEGSFDVDSAGSIAFASATGLLIEFIAANDITGSFASTDLTAASARLRNTTLQAGGAVTIGQIVTAVGNAVLTGSAVDAGSIDAANDIVVTATGAASLDNATGRDLSMIGGSVSLGSADLRRDLALTSTAGDVVASGTIGAGNDAVLSSTGGSISATGALTIGGDASFGSDANIALGTVMLAGGDLSASAADNLTYTLIDAGGFISLMAGGMLGGGNLIARTASIALDAATISIGDASSQDGFTASASGDLSFGTITNSNQDLSLSAGGNLSGTSVIQDAPAGSAEPDRVVIDAGGDLTLTGTAHSIDDDVLLTAGGALSVGTIDAANAIQAVAGGTATVGTVNMTNAGNTALLQGTAVALDDGSVAGSLTVNATAGDVSGTGSIVVGEAVDLDAAGAIAFGTIIAGTAFTADAGTSIAFTGAGTLDGDLTFNAGTDILGGDLDVAGILTLNGGFVALGDGSATAASISSGSDIRFDSLSSEDSITLTASGTVGANNGPGDIASGGDVTLEAQAIALNDVTTAGSVSAAATTGDATFGTISAAGAITVAAAGTPTIGNAISGGDTSVTGSSIAFANATIGGNLGLTATAGDIDANGAVSVGGAIDLVAAGDVAFGSLAAQTGSFDIAAGGSIAFAQASAGGSLDWVAGETITGGSITANGPLALGADAVSLGNLAASSIEIDTAGDALAGAIAIGTGAASGDIALHTAAAIGANSLAAGASLTLRSGTATAAGSLTAGGSIDAAAGTTLVADSAVAGDALILRAGGEMRLGDAIGGTVDLLSSGGPVVVARDLQSTFTGDGQLATVIGTSVSIDDLNELDLTLVRATDGSIALTARGGLRAVLAEATDGIAMSSQEGGVFVGFAEAGSARPSDIAVSAATHVQGEFVASRDIALASGRTIALDRAQAVRSISISSGAGTQIFGAVTAGADIAVHSGGDVRVTSSQASLAAGGDLAVETLGVFDTQGEAYGATVSITADDVVIGGTGRVGHAELTGAVTFTGFGKLDIGGTPVSGNFSLDADEFGRIRNTGDLTIRALPLAANQIEGLQQVAALNEPGDTRIVVHDLEIAAGSGGQIGAAGSLILDSGDEVDILGALTITGAGEDTGLRVRSDGRTWLDTAGGNLRVEGPGGVATGSIELAGSAFMAVNASALAEIAGQSPTAIDARLAMNDGVVREDGFLQAGRLEVTVAEAFFVQNSGAATAYRDRRGFAADFVAIDTGEGSNPLIVVNGVVGGKTGLDAIGEISFAGAVDPGSTINGCVITGQVLCTAIEAGFEDPARDLIESEFDPGAADDSVDAALESALISMAPSEQFEDDPLIDDPVTGAGNEDFWVEPSCEPGAEDEATCPTSGEAQPEGEEELEPAE